MPGMGLLFSTMPSVTENLLHNGLHNYSVGFHMPGMKKKPSHAQHDKLQTRCMTYKKIHGEQVHATWPPRMRIVPLFGFTNAHSRPQSYSSSGLKYR